MGGSARSSSWSRYVGLAALRRVERAAATLAITSLRVITTPDAELRASRQAALLEARVLVELGGGGASEQECRRCKQAASGGCFR